MYLTPTDKHWIVDIETDDLNATVVWVLCAINVKTKQEVTLTSYEEIRNWIAARIAEGCFFVGHNFLAFDAKQLNRLVGTRITRVRIIDTFLLSMLFSPSMRGGHSLEMWGERLGERKIQFNDFSRLTEDMIRYCLQDCRVNLKLYVKLTDRMRQVGISEKCCEIEHGAWHLIQKQQANGFCFDQPRAHALFAELRGYEEELKEKIYHQFPPQLLPVREYKRAFRADGSPSKNYVEHLQQYVRLDVHDDGTYTAYDNVEFNLGSPQQRIEKLLELGWVPGPDEYTKITEKGGGGNPTPTKKGELVPSLAAFAEEAGIEEVKLIATWMAINGRANMVGNWLDLYNHETGCIHGNLWLANTLRYRHDKPNTANIPAVPLQKVEGMEVPIRGRLGLYKYEARDLWTTRDKRNRTLIGVDAKGIQFRVLAHYLNDPEYTEVVLGGDIHEYNRSKTGVGTRAQNKTFGYAALLGAGAAKVGSIFGVSTNKGGRIKNNWIKGVPGLRALYDRLEGELNRTGRIGLCDGGRVIVSSPHMVLAYLLQGDESRIMKQAAIYTDEEVRRRGLDVLKVGDIHDEWQNDVLNRDADEYIKICEQSFKQAGETFNYNLPIESDAKKGLTWAETH